MPGRAARQQIGALERRVGDAELCDRFRVVGAPSSSRSSSAGIVAPHISVKRLIWPKLVIGMMPGMIGTSMPAARAPSTKSK